jgi:hypothetical protein
MRLPASGFHEFAQGDATALFQQPKDSLLLRSLVGRRGGGGALGRRPRRLFLRLLHFITCGLRFSAREQGRPRHRREDDGAIRFRRREEIRQTAGYQFRLAPRSTPLCRIPDYAELTRCSPIRKG